MLDERKWKKADDSVYTERKYSGLRMQGVITEESTESEPLRGWGQINHVGCVKVVAFKEAAI